MKRILTTMCALTLLLAASVPALAVEPEQSASYYPTSVEEYMEGDSPRIKKVYQLSLADDPSQIPTEDFERDGRLYYLLDMTRKDEVGVDIQTITQTKTLASETNNMEKILQSLEPQMEVTTEDGYTGTLTLDHTTVKVAADGYATRTKDLSATRTYPNLSEADLSLIPKSIEDNGKSLTLADVQWAETSEAGADGAVTRYTATAKYTGTTSSTYATGYGNPQITKVSIGVGKNPGILVSGHDLRDLEMLLEQTQGTGVDVYTHSEMLPAHYYPAFQKYPNFVGNYGNAWWKQKEEFETFHGPILMTTNCIVPPKDSYKDRLYTTGAAGYPGCKHIPGGIGEKKDFSALIEHAKKCEPPQEIERGEIVGGFAHAQVLALADKIVEAVQSGAIKKFVVMAGCDGRAKSREYYTEFAKALPQDAVILTAGCAKYKYNKLNLGDIGGIPRVLDAGQCNDSYSLAVIALKLKEVFGLEDINQLPIIYNIAWYEQKAVIVLLALLYLGVKNIHLGPTLPAFLSPNVAKVLVDNFSIAGIGTVEEDMALFFGENN